MEDNYLWIEIYKVRDNEVEWSKWIDVKPDEFEFLLKKVKESFIEGNEYAVNEYIDVLFFDNDFEIASYIFLPHKQEIVTNLLVQYHAENNN